MYGGVSKTYITWEITGSPYLKNGVYYQKVINPKTHLPKEVRFYTDKAHADLMPKTNESAELCKVFGFANTDDSILIIPDKYLTDDEREQYLHYNWSRFGTSFRYCKYFGGCWYGKSTDKMPPISRKDKAFICSWNQFDEERNKWIKESR